MKWIKVTDQLPEKNRLVIVFSENHLEKILFSCLDDGVFRDHENNKINVTHWMKLPRFPDEMG